MKQKFNITGMTCSACVNHVEKAVKNLDGISEVKVNLLANNMQVTYNNNLTNEDIIKAVQNAGYNANITGENTTVVQNNSQSIKKRIYLSIAFLLPLFYLSMGHMFNWPIPSIFLGTNNALIMALTLFLLTLPIMYLNRTYFINGFKTLFKLSPTMDSLIALGATAAVIYGIFAIYQIGYGLGHNNPALVDTYRMDLYFESAGMILTLITVGKYLESLSKARTTSAISQLVNLAPQNVTILKNGAEITIPSSSLNIDDIFIVRPGDCIVADGVVIEGSSYLDQSALTGESMPVLVNEGDSVLSASYNQKGYLKCQAQKVGDDTTLNQIIALVEEASASKAKISRLADKIASIFVPTVITIAILATIVWLILGYSFSFSLSIGIAVLVISCPCALGLATPVAIMAGTGKGAENGILIRNGEALENAQNITTVLLDKTGTLTQGKPTVTKIIPTNTTTELELLTLSASLEQASEHPLGQTIVNYSQEQNITLPPLSNFINEQGLGVKATINNHTIIGGNQAYLLANNIDITPLKQASDNLANLGQTPLYFAKDNNFLGIISVADVLKPSAVEAIDALKSLNLEVVMLTGDNTLTANAIAKQAHIDTVIAQVLPQDKANYCKQMQNAGKKVAMVGDGINDTVALTQANLGIALNTGSDIALNNADIILMSHDLCDIANALALSKATITNIKENLFWAFFYNSLGIPLAAGVFYSILGWKLNPMFATIAMSLSSLTVVSNALRLQKFKKPFSSSQAISTNVIIDTPILNKGDDYMTKTMTIEGMMCTHCSSRVEKVLNAIDGVSATVDLANKCANITLSQDVADDILIKAVTDAEYTVIDLK